VRYEQLLAEMYYQIGYQKVDRHGQPQHPLIYAYNHHTSPLEQLLQLALEELNELEEQHELALSKDWWKELADILVFLKSIQQRLKPNFSIEGTLFSVNGQYAGSLAPMKEQLANLSSGNIEHNLKHFITEILSMLKHLDQGTQAKVYLRVQYLIQEMQGKLNGNKESGFYQLEPGMTEDDIAKKYEHTNQALRILRSFLLEVTGQETVLQAWVTKFFAEEIRDWRDSAEALKRLVEKIPNFRSKTKDEVVWLLSVNPHIDRDPRFKLKCMIAGVLPNRISDRQPTPTGQNQGNNATLSTVFWV